MSNKYLDDLFEIKVGRGRASKMRQEVSSLVGLSSREKAQSLGKTEVYLKIGGANISTAKHLREASDYIARNGDLGIVAPDGKILSKDEYRSEIQRWTDEAAFVSDNTKSQSLARRIIISMPEGTDLEKFEQATREWAKNVLSNHDYLMAYHNHENDKRSKQPHVHILLRNVGKNGKRFHLNNAERRAVREHLAKCFRDVGIEVNATDRHIRGKTTRSLKTGEYRAIRRFKSENERARAHAIARKKAKKAELPKTFLNRVNEVRRSDKPIKDHPAITKLKKRRQESIAAFNAAARELEKGSPQDKALAKKLKSHANNLPPVESWQQQMQRATKTKQTTITTPSKKQQNKMER